MKLLTQTNKFYLIFLILLAPLMIVIDYFVIRSFVNQEVNEILENESERIKYYLENEKEFPSSSYISEITQLKDTDKLTNRFSDTLIYEVNAQKLIPYRRYDFIITIGNDKKKVTLKHVLLEVESLISWLSAVTAIIVIGVFIGLFFINQKVSEWVWRPFHRNLKKLKNYNLHKTNSVKLEDAGINEFKALNQVISTLMNQVEKDFQQLKEFNENISHEMQTPLSIIRNKMVLLMENPNLNERELQWIKAAYQEANKLSKIGKSLTLISRIENKEFMRLDQVDVRTTIDNIISNMQEIIHFKRLEITLNLDPVKINCDRILANILFTNLIKNAIQHNREGGYLRLDLSENKFEIENSGEVLETGTAHLFKRFQKGKPTADTLGLGLAINQKICELYGFKLDYAHNEGIHKFTLFFLS